MWRILFISTTMLVAGCGDGLAGIEGWVVETPRAQRSSIMLEENRPGEPTQNVVGSAWVELWTADRSKRLDRHEETKSGFFSVSYVGPYQPGMRYVVRAGAPGRVSLEQAVQLQQGGNWAIIRLAPVKKP